MHHFDFLKDLVIISALAVAVVLLFQRLKLPSIIGLIVAGIMAGKSGFGIVTDTGVISTLAELGVVLLLFAIGLEFSIDEFKKLKNIVLIGGSFQVLLTMGFIGVLSYYLIPLFQEAISWQTAIFLGMTLAISSTAICLKLLDDRGELTQPHGKIALGILIFQDIIVVPMMIGIKFLNPNNDMTMEFVAKEFGLLLVFAIAIIGGFRFMMPFLARLVSTLHAKEIAVLGALLLCFGSAYLTSLAGLSLALGGFIAGVIISSTDESHQIAESLGPFRDALTSIFFISVGLLLNISYPMLPLYLLLALVVLIINATLATAVGLFLGFSTRVSLIAGISLAQVGEFSFVLAEIGKAEQVIDDTIFQGTLAVIVITMIVTPALISFAPRVAERLAPALEFMPLRKDGSHPDTESVDISKRYAPTAECAEYRPHVIVIGFGESGKNISAVLKATNVRHVVLEKNKKIVEESRSKGVDRIFIGEGDSVKRLSEVGGGSADAFAVCISGLKETIASIKSARLINQNAFIIVRSRHLSEVPELYAAGANTVITEKFESSIQIFSQLLKRFDISPDMIMEQQEILRREFYHILPEADKTKSVS